MGYDVIVIGDYSNKFKKDAIRTSMSNKLDLGINITYVTSIDVLNIGTRSLYAVEVPIDYTGTTKQYDIFAFTPSSSYAVMFGSEAINSANLSSVVFGY